MEMIEGEWLGGVVFLLDYMDHKALLLLYGDLKKIRDKVWPNVTYIREEELDGMIMIIKSMINSHQ